MRNKLKSTDSAVDFNLQMLTYLMAVSYEMEGQTDSAIEAFTSVLHSKYLPRKLASRNQTLLLEAIGRFSTTLGVLYHPACEIPETAHFTPSHPARNCCKRMRTWYATLYTNTIFLIKGNL